MLCPTAKIRKHDECAQRRHRAHIQLAGREEEHIANYILHPDSTLADRPIVGDRKIELDRSIAS